MVGGGYSVSRLVPTDGCLIATDGLARVLHFQPEGPSPFIEVEAGMTIWGLNQTVAPFGLRPVMPSLFARPTVAGLMAVGGHGVGRGAGCFADGVDAIEYVDAAGERHRLERGAPYFEALTTSLGCLGAIYAVRVRLEPDHRIRVRQRRVTRERFLAELDDLIDGHDSVEFFMVPSETEVILLTFERTTAPCSRPPRWRPRRTHIDRLGCYIVEGFGRALANRASRTLFEITTRMTSYHLGPASWVDWASTAYHFQTHFPINRNACFAFDRTEVAAALHRFIDAHAVENRAGRYPLTMALHGRFTGSSGSWLSPAYGRPTAQLDLATHANALGSGAFFERMENLWLELPSARAHWGKHHVRARVSAGRYPRLAEFEAFRQEVDPRGVFLNDYLTEAVGLGTA